MEGVGGFSLAGIGGGVTKKRSQSARRPRTQPAVFTDYRESWSLSNTPSDNMSRGSSEDNNGVDINSRKKERNLNQCISNAPRVKTTDTLSGNDYERSPNTNFDPVNHYPSKRVNESSNFGQSGRVSAEGPESERHVRKLKLKLGGVTHTLHTQPKIDGAPTGLSSKSMIQGTSDVGSSLAPSQRIRDKNMSLYDLDARGSDNYRGNTSRENLSDDKLEAVRKSKRVPKRRVIDESYGVGSDFKSPKLNSDSGFEYEYTAEQVCQPKRSILRVSKRDSERRQHFDGPTSKEIRTPHSEKSSDDFDYSGEEDLVSEEDLGFSKKKKTRKVVDSVGESRNDLVITTRQRALQTGKDVSNSDGNLLEFPNGLPPASSKKQKEKLSDLEQQLKRAEALQKRRMQVAKANQELEAEAIRKILGQDSSRKKKENQMKKRQEELAQERAANAMKLAPDIVRWTSNLNGMFVTFPEEMGLPCILKQEKASYPPPREKCAGPSCPNTYKYRCSKTKLPLCSLQCYKAIQAPSQLSNACQ